MKKDTLPYRKNPCGNCPMRKDSLKGWLGRSRMTEILASDSFVCHKNNDLQCAGHMILLKESNSFVRLAKILGRKLNLGNQNLIFTNVKDCINHHDHER